MTEQENPWITHGTKIHYDNPWITVTEHDITNPGGGQGIYGTVHFKHLAIAIVPLDEDDNTWLVGQYRFPLNEYSWEVPEGGGSLDVDPVESARRELKEETGLSAEQLTEVGRLHLSNSVTDELGIIYVARGLVEGDPEPEEEEVLKIRKLPFQEAVEMVMDGRIMDALTITSILKINLLRTNGLL